jgi:hypothetical protein
MSSQHDKVLMIDGKAVRKFLLSRLSRVMHNKCIPVDTHERKRVLNRDDRRFIVLVEVEAFNIDHAITRLAELYPDVARTEWELQEELDPSHDVGMMGTKHPLLPQVTASKRVQ